MVATTTSSDQASRGMPMMAEPLLIDQFMPDYDLAVVYARVVRAPPEQSFNTVVDFDLFQLRTFRLRDMPSIGWMLLGERPGTELVFGQVGKPWMPRGGSPAEPVTRAEFAAFDQPGFAKLVESTRVDPYGERSSIVITETRVRCTDPDSRRRFGRYWLLVGPLSQLLRRTALHVWARKLEGPGCAC
jgi:hypothetical protein